MKIKKISKEHYIICDDSEIKEGDWIYNAEREPSILKCVGKGSLRGWQKITDSTQPLGWLNEYGFTIANLKPDWTNVEYLPLSEVKELLGVVDVERKALEINPVELDEDWDKNKQYRDEWVSGYNQALEDNKERKYTEQDIKKAIFLYTSWLTGGTATYKVGETAEQKIEQIIKSLQYKTEWEVQFIDGKLKIKK